MVKKSKTTKLIPVNNTDAFNVRVCPTKSLDIRRSFYCGSHRYGFQADARNADLTAAYVTSLYQDILNTKNDGVDEGGRNVMEHMQTVFRHAPRWKLIKLLFHRNLKSFFEEN